MLLADRGYDADWTRTFAAERGARANIPPRCNRNEPICFSPYLYRARNFGRAVLQQDQALSACGDALRQARGRPPRIRPARIHTPLAAR